MFQHFTHLVKYMLQPIFGERDQPKCDPNLVASRQQHLTVAKVKRQKWGQVPLPLCPFPLLQIFPRPTLLIPTLSTNFYQRICFRSFLTNAHLQTQRFKCNMLKSGQKIPWYFLFTAKYFAVHIWIFYLAFPFGQNSLLLHYIASSLQRTRTNLYPY